MKWFILSISLFIFSNSYSQSQFQTEEELIEFVSGVWNMDSLYSGWTGLHQIPSNNYFDSAYVHFHFVESDVPETPLLFRYYINGIFTEETPVKIIYQDQLTFFGHWFLEIDPIYNFPLTLVVNESIPEQLPLENNVELAEFAFDANSYFLTRCFPEFSPHGIPLLTQYMDEDGDGFGQEDSSVVACEKMEGFAYASGDCNDQDPSINPDAEEIEGNNIDENCDGVLGTTYTNENELATISIYPNPTNHSIIIESNTNRKFTASLYSIHGTRLASFNSPNKIEMDHYPAACYILKYAFEGENPQATKVVKQ